MRTKSPPPKRQRERERERERESPHDFKISKATIVSL